MVWDDVVRLLFLFKTLLLPHIDVRVQNPESRDFFSCFFI